MNLSMKGQLQQEKRKNQVVKERKIKQSKQKSVERNGNIARKSRSLSERELRYLMGVNMQTLKRGKGGAWKR